MNEINGASNAPTVTDGGALAGYTLADLRSLYRHDLLEDYVPFHDKYVVDHERGGFMVAVDRDGTQSNSSKRTWYLGRGLWTYSFLYNKVEQDPRHLEVARKAAEFILARKPDGDAFWPASFSKEGKPIAKPESRFYGDLFIANGLGEFSKVPGYEEYWATAKEIVLKCVRRYDREDYPAETLGRRGPTIRAPRIQGHWMCLINTIHGMLENRQDAELARLIDRSVDAVLTRHYNPAFQLNNEVLNHDLSRPDNDYAQQVLCGHSIEGLWMILYEAARRRDKKLWDTAVQRFKRHVEVAWDDVYGGAYHTLSHVDRNEWVAEKAQWLQAEILVGTLFLVEHTGDKWAKDWFGKTYRHLREKWSLEQYGFPLWIDYSDRKVTFQRHASRAENFHQPRHLMLNLLSIERMIERQGRVSGLWDQQTPT